MHASREDKRRWIIAIGLTAISFVRFAIDILSGALFGDASEAYKNAQWLAGMIPNGLMATLLVTAIGLLVFGPATRAWQRLERSLLHLDDPPQVDGIPQEVPNPVAALETIQSRPKFDPYEKLLPQLSLGWSDPPPERKPGELGGPIDTVMLERRMIREEKLRGRGIDKRTYPEPMECPHCDGNGDRWGRYAGVCLLCGGTGELPGELLLFPPCKKCGGNGCEEGRYEKRCPVCEGYGRRVLDKELLANVKIAPTTATQQPDNPATH